MKALWIRVEAHKVDSIQIAQLAEALAIDPVLALGYYTALGGAIAEHTETGYIADVPNATLELWARWKGKKGDLARAVREILQDGDGNYDEWNDTMGKLVERRAKDRLRKERADSVEIPPTFHGNSTESPPTLRGNSSATVRDGTGRNDLTTTTRPAARAGDPTFDGVMALVRERLYVHDGQPPSDWAEGRDGSILKQLRKSNTYEEIGAAIAGLALVRDHPGKYADPVDWLHPGDKVTLRALYRSKSGVLPMFNLATIAYWKHANAIVAGSEGAVE